MFVNIRIAQTDLDKWLAKFLDKGHWKSFDVLSDKNFCDINKCEYLIMEVEFKSWASVCLFWRLQKTDFDFELNSMAELTSFLLKDLERYEK